MPGVRPRWPRHSMPLRLIRRRRPRPRPRTDWSLRRSGQRPIPRRMRPVATAFWRTDAASNGSSYYLGALGLAATAELKAAVMSADLLVIIGTRLSELTNLRYTFPTPAQKVVHIDIDAEVLTAQSAVGQLAILGDAKVAIRGLLDQCLRAGCRGPPDWGAAIEQQIRVLVLR